MAMSFSERAEFDALRELVALQSKRTAELAEAHRILTETVSQSVHGSQPESLSVEFVAPRRGRPRKQEAAAV